MSLRASIVTRTDSLFEGPCEQVVIPAETGELGILSGHTPTLGVLGEGRVRVTANGETKQFSVKAGMFSVDSDYVTVAAHCGSVAEA